MTTPSSDGNVAVEAVSALSCLGDHLATARRLVTDAPADAFEVSRSGAYGAIHADALSGLSGAGGGHTRAERIILALVGPLRERLDACLAGVDPARVAVVVGTTAGGIAEAESTRRPGHRFGPDYDFRFQRLGRLAGFTADAVGARGLVTGVSTACTSGARAIGLGMRWLNLHWCDAAVVGGVDARCEMTRQGFSSLEAVSPGFCRPFDRDRDGITLGEGGALLVLVRAGKRSRGRVTLAGYADAMDAWHASAPHPDGDGIARAMDAALAMAGLGAESVGYVNMHGTGTVLNDAMEAKGVRGVLGPRVPVSSTKAMTGHTLGAAGALEAVVCHSLLEGVIDSLPVQRGMTWLDPELAPLEVVTDEGRRLEKPVIVSNSCGFGGHNASLVLTREAH